MAWTGERSAVLSHERDWGVTMSKSLRRLSDEILHCKHVCKRVGGRRSSLSFNDSHADSWSGLKRRPKVFARR